MKGTPSCTLIITTYNWPEALSICLKSVQWQTKLPDEVIIADDGSREETAFIISKMKDIFPVPIYWVWHEDDGKRKTRINNIAIARASFDYIIFIDHDIVLHPRFIEDHLRLAEKGYFINGSRFLTDENFAKNILIREKISPTDFQKASGKNALNKIRIPLLMKWMAHRYQTKGSDVYKVRGCNMSFWKSDLIAVNGYDERYRGWGREDSDIAARLSFHGVQRKSIKFGGITYHLWHKEAYKKDDDVYLKMLYEAIDQKSNRAELGLDQHM